MLNKKSYRNILIYLLFNLVKLFISILEIVISYFFAWNFKNRKKSTKKIKKKGWKNQK